MTTPRPSHSGCASIKRSAPISFFGMSDAKKPASLSRNPRSAPFPASADSDATDVDPDAGVEWNSGIPLALAPPQHRLLLWPVNDEDGFI